MWSVEFGEIEGNWVEDDGVVEDEGRPKLQGASCLSGRCGRIRSRYMIDRQLLSTTSFPFRDLLVGSVCNK